MKKKKKPTKKQFKNTTIFFSALSVYSIIRAIQYACDYEMIRQVTSQATFFLIMEMILAVCIAVLTIIMIVQFTRYDEHSKDSDE